MQPPTAAQHPKAPTPHNRHPITITYSTMHKATDAHAHVFWECLAARLQGELQAFRQRCHASMVSRGYCLPCWMRLRLPNLIQQAGSLGRRRRHHGGPCKPIQSPSNPFNPLQTRLIHSNLCLGDRVGDGMAVALGTVFILAVEVVPGGSGGRRRCRGRMALREPESARRHHLCRTTA